MRASCRRQCSGAEKQTGSLIQPLSHPSKNTSASRRNIVSPYILPGKKTTAKTKNTKNVCTDEKNYIISPTLNGHSSVGRALVSKTKCREFESLCPCRTTKTAFPAVFLLAKTFFKPIIPTIKNLCIFAVALIISKIRPCVSAVKA